MSTTATKSYKHARTHARAAARLRQRRRTDARTRSRHCHLFQSGGGGGGANMPKKKGEYSVLSEVNTEDEWLQLCKKEVSGARGQYKRSSRLIQGDPSRCLKPPFDFRTKVPFWPGQNETFVLKSTGGFKQLDGSPCILVRESRVVWFNGSVGVRSEIRPPLPRSQQPQTADETQTLRVDTYMTSASALGGGWG